MNIQEGWEKALHKTDIVRPRVQGLSTTQSTQLPYILLSSSAVNEGDTVVRTGEITVEKPSLILPFFLPHFEGFEGEEEDDFEEDLLTTFLMVRGVQFPSLKYNNKTASIEVFEGRLNAAVRHFGERLARAEDVHTGLLVGPEDAWQFSLLIYISSQISKNADRDIRRLMEERKKNGWPF